MTATTLGEDSRQAPVATARPVRGLGWLLVVGGAVGLLAATALMLEKLAKLTNPAYIPTCSLNPVVSCGSVMDSSQAAAFGFPNPLIGVASFAVVVAVGVVLLCGFVAPRWFWLGLLAGTTFGVIFVHWLIFQSLYDIGALCPYCMVVWAVTIPIFWYTALYTLRDGHLGAAGRRTGVALSRVHSFGLTAWYLVIVVLVLQAFWQYWTTLL